MTLVDLFSTSRDKDGIKLLWKVVEVKKTHKSMLSRGRLGEIGVSLLTCLLS